MSGSNKEKRSFFRHPISVPLRLKLSKNTSRSGPETSDISPTGLSFFWTTELPRGQAVSITLPIKEKQFKISGEIVYSSENPRTGLFKIGVMFRDTASAFQAKLAEEVLEILEYQKKISQRLHRPISEDEAAKRWVKKYAAYFSKLHAGL